MVNTQKLTRAFGLLKEAFWQYKRRFLVTTILGLFAGLFGGLGIGAIIPLFAFIAGPDNQALEGSDFITDKIQAFLSFFHLGLNLPILIALIVGLFLLKAVITFLSYYATDKVVVDYEKNTRKKLFKKTVVADWPFLSEQKIGHVESILMNDVHMSSGILATLTNIIMVATSIIMYAFIAINISAPITFLTLGFGILLFLLLKPFFYRIRKLGEEFGKSYKKINHIVSEHLIGAKTIKANSAENKVTKLADEEMEKLRDTTLKMELYNKAPGSFMEPIGIIFISVLFLFYYYFSPGFNIASFAVIVFLVQKKFSFMQSINARFNGINGAIPHLQSVLNFEKSAERHQEINAGKDNFSFENNITVKNLSFGYGDKDGKVLDDINLTINKGGAVGLVGPSGVGKTTLVDIFLRLLQPGAGDILIDGKSMSQIDLSSWRKNIGYVSQDAFLLNDTVENNIKFYDDSVSQHDITEASKAANIYDFIMGLPEKFQTIAGERGVRLSGGQKQRIALARALAKKPKILILDEATSALDNESEMLIQKSIEKLKNKVTVILIAHRPSTVMISDHLFVLGSGKIIEDGAPKELLKNKDSYFSKVYNNTREDNNDNHQNTV